MKFKRLIAGVASVTLCASLITVMLVTAESSPLFHDASMSADESIFGADMISRTLTDGGEDTNAEQPGYPGCDINFVNVKGRTAQIELETDRDCTLVAAVYEQDGVKMLDSAMKEVSSGDTYAELTFAEELPGYFCIRAYLVDSDDLSPLCEDYADVFTPEDRMTSDEYFAANSTVSSVESVSESNMYSEAEVAAFLHERGFDEEITYDYTAEGKMVLDGVVSEDSEERRPQYETFYISETGLIWRILVIGKSMILYATDIDAQTYSESFLAESSVITSYDIAENRFITNTPNESVMKIKVVSRIDAAALDTLTMEGIEAL